MVSSIAQLWGMLTRQRQNFTASAGTKGGGLASLISGARTFSRPALLLSGGAQEKLRRGPTSLVLVAQANRCDAVQTRGFEKRTEFKNAAAASSSPTAGTAVKTSTSAFTLIQQ